MKRILSLTICIFFIHFCFGQKNDCKTKIRTEYPTKTNFLESKDSNQIWNVPVIFHILYNSEKQNIPDSLIFGVLETLNSDFLCTNNDLSNVPIEFKQFIGNPNVNFKLAAILPNGQSTIGIIRKYTSIREFKYRQRKMFYESPRIDSKRYLNVYVCNVNTNAFTPTENNSNCDGVVIDYTRVFKNCRTLTHEAGHWFDLRHIFEGGCNNNDVIDDTPPQKKHSQYCPKYPNKDCGKSTMFMNYMDYSSCRYFFTTGQVTRMRNYIINYKQF